VEALTDSASKRTPGIFPAILARAAVFGYLSVRHSDTLQFRAGTQLKVAGGLAVASLRAGNASPQCLEQHGLLIQSQFSDFVQELQPLVGAEEQAGDRADTVQAPWTCPKSAEGTATSGCLTCVNKQVRDRQSCGGSRHVLVPPPSDDRWPRSNRRLSQPESSLAIDHQFRAD
jgi:hypothetical protein